MGVLYNSLNFLYDLINHVCQSIWQRFNKLAISKPFGIFGKLSSYVFGANENALQMRPITLHF